MSDNIAWHNDDVGAKYHLLCDDCMRSIDVPRWDEYEPLTIEDLEQMSDSQDCQVCENCGHRLLEFPLEAEQHTCPQCGRDMGLEWFLGPVCGKCTRKNHKAVTSGKRRR